MKKSKYPEGVTQTSPGSAQKWGNGEMEKSKNPNTPKGLNKPAQGQRSATLGKLGIRNYTPKGLNITAQGQR